MRRRFFLTSNGGQVNNYLTIVALEDGLTASLSNNACEYCVDGDGDWKALSAATSTEPINAGQTLSFRAELTPNTSYGIGTFTISKRCNLEGNCMSMLFGDNAADNLSLEDKVYAFFKLFYECDKIITVSDNFLPAITLGRGVYHSMFYYCTGLTVAPNLPAKKVGLGSYYAMFQNCTSLQTAPELPATEISTYCYDMMFFASGLRTAPAILPATELFTNCYSSMFRRCTKLTNAPVLPATKLANTCYQYMFEGSRNINYIKMLATDISASKCLYNWVTNVASRGTFVKNSAMTSLPTGVSGIPSGWTVENA